MSEQNEKLSEIVAEAPTGGSERFPDLVVLQQEIEKRIRDNRRFLERFMSDDFAEEDEEEEGDRGEDFEEL